MSGHYVDFVETCKDGEPAFNPIYIPVEDFINAKCVVITGGAAVHEARRANGLVGVG